MSPWEHRGYCDCGRIWDASGEAHCAECHQQFTSDSGFEAHRRDGICQDPATLTRVKSNKRVFAPADRASGDTWKLADDRPHGLASKPRASSGEAA